jgi:hypothetical protein
MPLCDSKKGHVLRELQRGFDSLAAWRKRWDIKINEEKTQAIYFSQQIRPLETILTTNRRNIPFVNGVKHLGIIFCKKITWRMHIETVTTAACGTFIRRYSLFETERLSTHFKLTLHKVLLRSVLPYACPAWEFAADTHLMKLQ